MKQPLQSTIKRLVRDHNRPTIYRLIIRDNESVVFDDAWHSIKFMTRAAAEWFADLLQNLMALGGQVNREVCHTWQGDLMDDCSLKVPEYDCHAEHLQGPFGKGGIWCCQVWSGARSVFHSADHELQIRSGPAARWLCELMVQADQLRDTE